MLHKIWVVIGAVVFLSIAPVWAVDSDGDGIDDAMDNCPNVANPDQAESDGDGIGNACDNCPEIPNVSHFDSDGDGRGNACDPCPFDPLNDPDADQVCGGTDNCPYQANSDQVDVDDDGSGDACDNCVAVPNASQMDADGNGVGDACNDFEDGDGDDFADSLDNCPLQPNGTQLDTDGNGVGDACNDFEDADGDEIADILDNCPTVANVNQTDVDNDGLGNKCDPLTVCASGCDFTSIQMAVDIAESGDTVDIGSGTFYENVYVPWSKDLTIRGGGKTTTVIDGGGLGPVFLGGRSLQLQDMTIQNGVASGVRGDHITIDNCLVVDNEALGPGRRRVLGGGVFGHSVVITQSEISGNTSNYGGGVYVYGPGWAAFDQSTIAGNSAVWAGGGVTIADGDAYIENTTISGNTGGGVFFQPINHQAAISVTNSTISGNEQGAGLYAFQAYWGFPSGLALVAITQSTISGNESGGIVAAGYYYSYYYGYRTSRPFPPFVLIGGSVVANNTGPGCWSNLMSSGYPLYFVDYGSNFADDDSCPGELITGLDPVLRNNGGPTKTHALLRGSSAIDVAGGYYCPPTDQRGVGRPQDGDGDGDAACDAGAFEFHALVIDIDIKPDNFPSSINPNSRGVIPVAILGSDAFDVADVDVTTLAFGPGGASTAHNLTDSFTFNDHLRDVNLDGFADLVTHYRTRDTGIVCGDESVTLTGETLDGQLFQGTDSIVTVGCRRAERPWPWTRDDSRMVEPRGDPVMELEGE